MIKKYPKKVIRNKYFKINIPNLYGDMEVYPSVKAIRSFNKMQLRKGIEDSFKTTKKGFVEFY